MCTSSVLGYYKGERPNLIKVRPEDLRILGVDLKLLDEDPQFVRYVVISKGQIRELHKYTEEKVFP